MRDENKFSSPENNESRKEEILEKSRRLKQDEGVEAAELKGYRTGGIIADVLVGTPLLFFFMFNGQSIAATGLLALSCAIHGGYFFELYRFTKKKWRLVMSIIFASCTIVFTFFAVAAVQGWL